MSTTVVETVDSTRVESQVFLAIEDDMYMPIGEKVELESLARCDDGVFPNEKSWRAFILGNFADGAGGAAHSGWTASAKKAQSKNGAMTRKNTSTASCSKLRATPTRESRRKTSC